MNFARGRYLLVGLLPIGLACSFSHNSSNADGNTNAIKVYNLPTGKDGEKKVGREDGMKVDGTTRRMTEDGRRKMKVAVIGAGVSGLVATKCLVEEGHDVTTFEKSNQIGGNWTLYPPKQDLITTNIKRVQDNLEHENPSSCYNNMYANTHYATMAFSDLRMSAKKYGVYPHHYDIKKFINLYYNKFMLRDYIKFNSDVLRVVPLAEGYNVTYASSDKSTNTTQYFDAVAVCNGHNATAYWPRGIRTIVDNFSGDVIHSRSYRDPSHFNGKNVLVIGGGVSGKQIVYDVSKNARSAAISSSRPINEMELYKANPFHKLLAKFTNSTISIKPQVQAINNGKQVVFADGTVGLYDVIIACTGYQNSFPFLQSNDFSSRYEPFLKPSPVGSTPTLTRTTLSTSPDARGDISTSPHTHHLWLYKNMFPVPKVSQDGSTLKNYTPTLGFIGMIDVVDASLFPYSEIQSRWFARLLSGATSYPPTEQIHDDMGKWLEKANLTYHPMSISANDRYIEDITQLMERNK